MILESLKQMDPKADAEYDNLLYDLQHENKDLKDNLDLVNCELANLKKEFNNNLLTNTIDKLEDKNNNLTKKEKQ